MFPEKTNRSLPARSPAPRPVRVSARRHTWRHTLRARGHAYHGESALSLKPCGFFAARSPQGEERLVVSAQTCATLVTLCAAHILVRNRGLRVGQPESLRRSGVTRPCPRAGAFLFFGWVLHLSQGNTLLGGNQWGPSQNYLPGTRLSSKGSHESSSSCAGVSLRSASCLLQTRGPGRPRPRHLGRRPLPAEATLAARQGCVGVRWA